MSQVEVIMRVVGEVISAAHQCRTSEQQSDTWEQFADERKHYAAKLCALEDMVRQLVDDAGTTSREQPQQEPLTWLSRHEKDGVLMFDEEGSRAICGWSDAFPVYTTPPRREWVGLTEEEIDRALDDAKVPELPGGYESVELEIARAIEAKLKEKNANP